VSAFECGARVRLTQSHRIADKLGYLDFEAGICGEVRSRTGKFNWQTWVRWDDGRQCDVPNSFLEREEATPAVGGASGDES
jgi:hypothetical protein